MSAQPIHLPTLTEVIMTRNTVPLDIKATLTDRTARYGRFSGIAAVSQSIKSVWQPHAADHCKADLAPDQREALEMIGHKIARIVNGDPNHVDSWLDIAGYATLVADRLQGIER